MTGGADKPGRTRGFGLGALHGARMVALKFSFGLGNILRRPDRWTSIEDASARGLVKNPAAAAFAGAVLGCLTTLYLCAFGIAPGIASALATSLICGPLLIMRAANLLPADFFTAVYGGSFGGMTPVLLLYQGGPDHRLMVASVLFMALSIVSGLVFGLVAEIDTRAGRRLASGYGGRSGAIATLSSFLFVAVVPVFGADDRLFRSLSGDVIELDLTSVAITCAACAVGLFATMSMLRWRSVAFANQADRTFLASVVALIGMVALHLNNPNDAHLLDAFYAGCFLGMSAPERLGGWFAPLVGALVLTAMLVLVRMFLPGLGGSLGLAAFATVVVLVALSTLRVIPKGRVARHAAGVIAYPVAGVLALGCFVVLLGSAPQQPAQDRAISAEATTQAVPSPAQPPLALAVSHAANELPPLEAAAASAGSVDLAIKLDLPHDMKIVERALPESAEQPAPASMAAEVSAASQPALSGASDVPARATSYAAVPAIAGPLAIRGPVDEAADTDEKLFHEFMQWRAAHGGGTIQGRPQPARPRTRPPQLVGLVTPAAVQAQVRPARPRPPSSIDPTGWPASTRPPHPPRAVHNATGNPAPNATP
ncbi:hypothetical protein [Bradyrhizobium sp.]|uniref:hypothetical protein n=1 Tax=Bradyrhizobium sp. TaxID=376 RepID=UPI002CD55D90|nr:hypothetical protein [Bradyrhizobium sp.]HWX57441.1 hypothetical protein [Bradyrhizobium sp.]